MTASLRIAVAEDEIELLEDIQETLAAMGHEVVVAVGTGKELVEQCLKVKPDLVITDIKMPDMDGLEAAEQLGREMPLPIVIVSAYHDPEFVRRAMQNHVLSYLVKPIKDADLETSIVLARCRFREFQALHHQANDLKQALEDRKVVERAKGILMKRAQLDEQEAFRRLQELASNENEKMVSVARNIIVSDKAFHPAKT